LIESASSPFSLDLYLRLQAIEMSSELHQWAITGNLERVKQLVEGGADIEDIAEDGMTVLSCASEYGRFDVVAYLVGRGANVAHTGSGGMTALHFACINRNLLCVIYLLEHGAKITERDNEGKTVLLHAAENGSLEIIQYLLSSEGGASITETDDMGNTALLVAAGEICEPKIVQWLLEYGGAQITDTNNGGASVWTVDWEESLLYLLRSAYKKDDDGEYVLLDGEYIPTQDTVEITAMLRVMVLHGGPPESLTAYLAPPFQRIVQDGARLRARLPAYFMQRRALLEAQCPLLPPLQDLVHGYEKSTTTEELWATGLGARAKRLKPERGQSQAPERRSARLSQKRL
jgi:ankyrin repeat protein